MPSMLESTASHRLAAHCEKFGDSPCDCFGPGVLKDPARVVRSNWFLMQCFIATCIPWRRNVNVTRVSKRLVFYCPVVDAQRMHVRLRLI